MKAALLALLLALPARAQDAPKVVVQVQDGYVRNTAGETVQVRGGAWLDGPTLLATGKELAALRAENEALKVQPVAAPSSILVAVAIGAVAGLAGGVALGLTLRR